MPRRSLAALTIALALAAPGAAFAQSAGDEQYQDPFGGDDQSQSGEQTGGGSGGSGDSSSSGGGTQTAQATPAPTAAPSATTAQATPAAPAAQQLPRTGGDPITPAVAGFWLLLGGVALRARVRTR